jgi:hypothetical protein
MLDFYAFLNVLLILHLAGLVMGFVGGRAHGEIVTRLKGAGPDATEMLWALEKKASWTAFTGTALLIASGSLMLWLKYGGIAGQSSLFWLKMVLVLAVSLAEIVRHLTALQWKSGNESMEIWTKLAGKFSGLAAIATVAVAVFNFN